MDLKYVEDLNQPFEVFRLLLLLSLLPLLATVATTVLLRPGTDLGGKPQGRLSRIPLVKHAKRRTLLVLAVLPTVILVTFDVLVLDELLLLPGGGFVAFGAIVTGLLLGLLVTMRPRPRALKLAAAGWIVIAVVGAIVFSSFQSAPSAGSGSDDGVAPGKAPVELVTPSETAAPQETPDATAAPSATASASTAPYEPARIVLPTGSYGTSPICLDGHGDTPVSVTAASAHIVRATLPNGSVVEVGDIAELRPCEQAEGGDREQHTAPSMAVTALDGGAYQLDGNLTVARVATLESDGGEQLVLIWRRVDGVTYPGLIRADQLRD